MGNDWKNSKLQFVETPEGFDVFQEIQGNRIHAGNVSHGSFVAYPHMFALNGADLLAIERATTNEGWLAGMNAKESS